MAERPKHIPISNNSGLKSAMKQPSSYSGLTTPTSPPSSTLVLNGLLGQPLTATSTGTSLASTSRQGYLPKVSFDTFENPAAPMFSFTLQVKSDGYRRNRQTRVFLCAASPDESGSEALDWTIESLVQDGDELIVFRGFDADELEKDQDALRDEARDLMQFIQAKNVQADYECKLSIIVEFIAGRVTDTIDRLIALYRPDSLIVGTRGTRRMQMLGAAFGGMGSVSKYCLSHSPVPVIVVRPERKVRKAMQKRRADPKRGIHFEEAKNPSSIPLPKSPLPS